MNVKEIPILFSTPMVQAILEGRKTMTRRVINQLPASVHRTYAFADDGKHYWNEGVNGVTEFGFRCPYGKPGDVLWLRESWNVEQYPVAPEGDHDELLWYYKATEKEYTDMKWRPSIHMPKAAARIWLEVTDIRVERLHDISEDDAKAEGVEQNPDGSWRDYLEPIRLWQDAAKPSFISLWQSINGEDSWNANPWIWVVSFKVLSTTGKPKLYPPAMAQ